MANPHHIAWAKHKKAAIPVILGVALLVCGLGLGLRTTICTYHDIQDKLADLYHQARGERVAASSHASTGRVKGAQQVNTDVYVLPEDFKPKSTVDQYTTAGMQVFTLRPKNGHSKKHILYLHGGAYVHQPVIQHWQFLDALATASGATISVPMYPKAPKYHAQDAYEKVDDLYGALLKRTSASNLVVMGDSAGGGLALGFAEDVAAKGKLQSGQVILISPWLDITMSNPEVPAYASFDSALKVGKLRLWGKMWAGSLDRNDYRVSPINGSLRAVTSEISLFVGTHEVFLPDAQKFARKAALAGKPINYYEYPLMRHVFPLSSLPEAARAQTQILELLDT